MRNYSIPLLGVALVIFATAPVAIYLAPYESTMGLVQKIFYYHVPAGILMLVLAMLAGIASVMFLVTGKRKYDHWAVAFVELVVLFGAMTLVTGPLWARKSWGVWWDWEPRLTSSLLGWLVSLAYLLLRRFGGPGSDKLAAGLALFGIANAPFVYVSVNYWRTMHPKTTVLGSLVPPMAGPIWFGMAGFVLMAIVLFAIRVQLEEQRDRVEALYLAADES